MKDGELLGDFLSTFDDKPATLLMGQGQLSPALEASLMGLTQGTHTRIELPAGQAFGQRNPDMIQTVSRRLMAPESELEGPVCIGDMVEFTASKGTMSGTVLSINADAAVVDFNHPLAGQAVQFEVQLIAVL